MSRIAACLLSILLAGALAMPVMAAETIDASNVDAILALVKTYGEADLQAGTDGDPLIIGHLDDTPFVLFFKSCVEHKDCKFVSFYARWENAVVTTELMDTWNARAQFSRSYFEKPGVAVVQMETNLVGGVTPANFSDTIDWFRVCVNAFQTQVIDKGAN